MAPVIHISRLLHLQRIAGNASVAHLLGAKPTSSAVQRVSIVNEKKSDIFLAVKVGGSRYDETLDIIKSLGDTNFDSIDKLKERVTELLPSSGVFLGGKSVSIVGIGSRYNAHISLDQAIAYIRQFRNEIKEGSEQSLKVGEGRTKGFAVWGRILCSFSGSTISIYHAHDSGKMG